MIKCGKKNFHHWQQRIFPYKIGKNFTMKILSTIMYYSVLYISVTIFGKSLQALSYIYFSKKKKNGLTQCSALATTMHINHRPQPHNPAEEKHI